MKLDMPFHKSHTTGSIIEPVDGDINNLVNFFANFAVILLSNIVLMFGIIVLLFFEGWLMQEGGTRMQCCPKLLEMHQNYGKVWTLWAAARRYGGELLGRLGLAWAGSDSF